MVDKCGSHPLEKSRLLHDAAAQQDAFRGQDIGERTQSLRQIRRFEFPDLGPVVELGAGQAPTALDGGSGRHAFETGTVERAVPRIVVAGYPLERNVTHLGVAQAVVSAAAHPGTGTDPCSHCDVHEATESLCGAPTPLAERGAAYVDVDRGRDLEVPLHPGQHRRVAPVRFRC